MTTKIENTEPRFGINDLVVCVIYGTPTMGYIKDIDIHITRSHDIIVWYDVLVGRKRFKIKEQQLKVYEQANSI